MVREQAKALELLAQEGTAAWKYEAHEHFTSLSHLEGRSAPFMARGMSGKDATLAFLGKYRALYKMVDPMTELTLLRDERDELLNTHVRMQQVVEGIQVRGGELIAHFDKEGALTSLDANFATGLDGINKSPTLRAEQATALATRDLMLEVPELDAAKLDPRENGLRIYAPGDRAPTLAYHLRIRGDAPNRPVLMDYMIDAHTGLVLEKYNDIETITATGKGTLGDTKTLQVEQSGGAFRLVDSTRAPGGISTSSAGGSQTEPGDLVTGSDGSFDTGGVAPGSAVDAHYYAGIVYDYYKATHTRLGIDGANSAIVSTVHYGQAYNNAFWDGTQMVYGDGDGRQFRSFTASIDVIAHELTHGVTQSTSNLIYNKQSGALNEAVSDIFGCLVTHAAKPDPVKNWQLGADLSLQNKPFRDMIHPANGQQPAAMSQYINTSTDNGGVHTNSGIVNNAMYLMTMGGTNDATKTVVPFGLGWDKAGKLWYAANTKYFMSATGFAQAAQGTLTAARDLQFTANDQNIIECAWIATGVLPGTCKTIVADAPTMPDGGGGSPAGGGGAGGGAGGGGDGGASAGGGSDNGSAGHAPSTGGTSNPGGPAGSANADEPGDGTTTGTAKAPSKAKRAFIPDSGSGCSAAPRSPADPGSLLLLVAGVAIVLRRRSIRAAAIAR